MTAAALLVLLALGKWKKYPCCFINLCTPRGCCRTRGRPRPPGGAPGCVPQRVRWLQGSRQHLLAFETRRPGLVTGQRTVQRGVRPGANHAPRPPARTPCRRLATSPGAGGPSIEPQAAPRSGRRWVRTPAAAPSGTPPPSRSRSRSPEPRPRAHLARATIHGHAPQAHAPHALPPCIPQCLPARRSTRQRSAP
jgi:hypothetical protein